MQLDHCYEAEGGGVRPYAEREADRKRLNDILYVLLFPGIQLVRCSASNFWSILGRGLLNACASGYSRSPNFPDTQRRTNSERNVFVLLVHIYLRRTIEIIVGAWRGIYSKFPTRLTDSATSASPRRRPPRVADTFLSFFFSVCLKRCYECCYAYHLHGSRTNTYFARTCTYTSSQPTDFLCLSCTVFC